MKIIHISSTYPPVLGGMEKVVHVLAAIQATMGASVEVVTSDQVGKTGIDVSGAFKVTRMKSFLLLSTVVMPALLLQLMKIRRGDIVHMHITQAYMPEMVWLASKLRHYKYVAHIHLDTPPTSWAGFLLVPYKKFILGRVLRAAAAVIVFTEDQKLTACKRYKLEPMKVKVVPNGVEEEYFNTAPRTMHKKPKLLFVGRLSLQKNLPMLIRSLSGISDQFETTLVGDGELKDELIAIQTELGVRNLTFAGRKGGNELLAAYKEADIFVLTSEREGMPLVLLEAMAMGLPIVATNVIGNRDVVVNGENGYLVKLGDAEGLGKALTAIKNDPVLYKKLSINSSRMAKQYSWKRVNAQVQDIYDEVTS